MSSTGSLFDSDLPQPPTVSKPRKRKGKRRTAEDEFAHQCRAYQLPEPIREHMFAKSIGRRWRFDFAFADLVTPGSESDYRVAVEVEGLNVRRIPDGSMKGELVVRGRHASISGWKEDGVKYASAAMLGWIVLRFEQSQVKDKTAIQYTMRVLRVRGWTPPQT